MVSILVGLKDSTRKRVTIISGSVDIQLNRCLVAAPLCQKSSVNFEHK